MNSRYLNIAILGLASAAQPSSDWVLCADNCKPSDAMLVQQLNQRFSERLSQRRLESEILFHSADVMGQFKQTMLMLHPTLKDDQIQSFATWFLSQRQMGGDKSLLSNNKGFEMDFEKLDEHTQLSLMKDLDCSYQSCISAFKALQVDTLQMFDSTRLKIQEEMGLSAWAFKAQTEKHWIDAGYKTD